MRPALLITLAGLLIMSGCRSAAPPVPAEPERLIVARQPSSAERFWRSYIGTVDRYYEILERQTEHRRADRRLDRREDCDDHPQHCPARKPRRYDRR